MTITQYEYPVQGKGQRTIDDLAPGFLRDALACIGWLNMTPPGPLPEELVVAVAPKTVAA